MIVPEFKFELARPTGTLRSTEPLSPGRALGTGLSSLAAPALIGWSTTVNASPFAAGIVTGILVLVVLRFGLLACIASFFVYLTVWYVPVTFDATRPFFGIGLFVLAVVAAVPVIGYYLARAGEPLFGKVIED